MHILVSNDDGHEAPGLTCLVDGLKAQGWHVSVVATKENKSGYGQSLSLRKRIHVERQQDDFFIVDGTPADCVYLALQSLIMEPVDIVISGINNGANLGDDILYSGTFAAAMEARRLNLPSIAISIIEHDVQHYDSAVRVALELLQGVDKIKQNDDLAVLNVNLPDVAYEKLKGFKATRLGKRQAPQAPKCDIDEAGERYYWLGSSGDFHQQGEKDLHKSDLYRSNLNGSNLNCYDFQAVKDGYVSVTPLSSQLIHQPYMTDIHCWLNNL